MLRNWIPGPKISYDISAALNRTAVGDWTTDGFVRVDEIHLSANNLKIKATRQVVVSVGQKGFQFAAEHIVRKTKNHGVVEIEAQFSKDDLTEANAIWSNVFLTSQDNFLNFVPDYWKACTAIGISGKGGNCGFSSEISAVPGMANQTQSTEDNDAAKQSSTTPDGTTANLHAMTRVGGPVMPPRPIHQPEPPYSEAARKMNYHGVVTLGLIVTKDGVPEKIHIVTPLGCGLDAQAVRAVEEWRFKPAERDGHPVAVQIAVEVDFHLY